MKIKDIKAREILDSRGCPTVEAEVVLENGIKALGQVPSGISTGSNEAFELRDKDPGRYLGKGVLKAVANIKGPIKEFLIGKDAYSQEEVDRLLIDTDGTANKSNLGANSILAVSMAVCRAAARSQKIPLYQYFGQLSGNKKYLLPQPLVLVLEGGKHGNWSTDIQEYFIIPKVEVFKTFRERLRVGVEIFYRLGELLKEKGYATGVGDEGAYCPGEIKSNEEAFELIIEAVGKAGYGLSEQVVLGIDAAASEFYQNGEYVLKSEGSKKLKPEVWTEKLIGWLDKYPIWSLEDTHSEKEWSQWADFLNKARGEIQLVGDDLLTTNVKLIKKAHETRAVNSVLIKPNQIGTITETLMAIKAADEAGFTTIVSHRSGETNDELIADLVVGTSSWQCKFGGPDRGERVAKYNRLLRIEEQLILVYSGENETY